MRKMSVRLGLLLTLLTYFNLGASAQVQVGTGTTIGQSMPIEPYFGYSYSQVIYLASEINTSGDITELQWYFDGNSLSNSRNWTIYIGHTTKTEFSSTTDWVPVGIMTQVYSDVFTDPGASGWITFDITDWTYNGTDNIVVAVDENASSFNTNSDDFHCSAIANSRGLVYYSDGTNPDPSSPPAGNLKSYISNIIFGGITQTCPNPTTQSETNIIATSADLGWIENGTATTWNIEWGPDGFTQGSGTLVTGVTSNPYALSGLTQDTDYDWYVQADCGGGDESSWIGPSSFATLISCTVPTALTETNITTTSADLGWTENGTATTWNIEWGATGFTQGSGTMITGTTTNPYALSGLTAATTYDWYVQTDCGGGDMSLWVGPSSFTTACSIITAPYTDSFESQTPTTNATWGDCWYTSPAGTTSSYRWDIDASGSTPSTGTGPDGGANAGLNYAYTEATSGTTGAIAELYSPFIDISGLSIPELSFYYHMYGSTMGTLYIDVHDGSSWNNDEATIVGQQQTNGDDVWIQHWVDLSSYSGTIQIRFRGERGTSYTGDICIDDFSVDEAINCRTPTLQTESNISATTADLGWTENGTATTWNIEWGPTGFTQGGGTMVTGTTTNPHSLSGLTSNTDYDWYIQTDCGSGEQSTWTGPSTFSTNHHFPLTEDFESGFYFFENGPTNSWDYWLMNTSIYHGGTQSAHTTYQSTTGNILHESGVIDLSATTSPLLTFWQIAKTYSYDDRCYIEVSIDGGATYTALPSSTYLGTGLSYRQKGYFDEDDYPEWEPFLETPGNTWWRKEAFDLSSYKTNNVRFRFNRLTDDGSYNEAGWYLDDIIIDEANCFPTALTESNITTTSADLSWTETGSATTWNIEWGPIGFALGNGTTVSGITTEQYSLTGLTLGTSYDWYLQSDCGGQNENYWSGPNTFNTLCDLVTVPYIEDFDAVIKPFFPLCMTVENTDADDNEWMTDTWNSISNPNAASIGYSATNSKNDWFFTNGLMLTGGVEYILNFIYSGPNNLQGSKVEKLEVYWGNDATSSAMTNGPLLYNDNIVYTGYYDIADETFTPATSGTYYIGFHAFSDAAQASLTIDDISVVENVAQTSWTGGTSDDWRDESNWNNGIPGSQTNVIIGPGATHYPRIKTHMGNCNDILVQSGPSGDGAIISSWKLYIWGNLTVQRYVTDGGWHDISASTGNQTVNSLYQGPSGPNVWLRTYDEPANTRTYITDLTTPMPPGKGFEVWVESSQREDVTFEFTGLKDEIVVLNTTSTPAISYTSGSPQSDYGYNLIGNPFPCPIDWDIVDDDLYFVSGTAWVWDHAAGNWKDRVGGVGSLTDGIIPMGQGFFIQTTGPSCRLALWDDHRVNASQDYYKKSSSDVGSEFDQVSLLINNDFRNDELNIVFRDEANDIYDVDFDGRKLFSIVDEAPAIYSYQNEESLSTNALPSIENETRTVDVHFIAGVTDDYKIQAEISNLENIRIFLEDKFLGEFIDLRTSPEYNFSANTSDDNDRFVLHFNPVITDVGESANENLINVYAYDDKICIKSHGAAANERKQVWVYDLSGRIALNKLMPASGFTTIPVTHLKGYFVVKVLSESGVKTDKIYIK